MLEAFVIVIGVYGLLPRDAENNDRRKVPLAASWRSGGKHTRFAASVLTRLFVSSRLRFLQILMWAFRCRRSPAYPAVMDTPA
jgi:hypothetical protein